MTEMEMRYEVTQSVKDAEKGLGIMLWDCRRNPSDLQKEF